MAENYNAGNPASSTSRRATRWSRLAPTQTPSLSV